MTIDQFIEGILHKNRRVIARAITLVESTHPHHRQLSAELYERLKSMRMPHMTKKIGITGPPGVGKSTFIEAYGLYLIQQNYSVAVIAIDPSSKISHGSILGDKVRMPQLSMHSQAFVRPVPSGDTLGGISIRTLQILTILEFAQFDFILVETVGVGQNETSVYDITDMFMHLYNPLSGDEIQGIKRGIMELSDVFLITKSDNNFTHESLLTENKLRNALSFLRPTYEQWKPQIIRTSSIEKMNFDTITECIMQFFSNQRIIHQAQQRRVNALQKQTNELMKEAVFDIIRTNKHIESMYETLLTQLLSGEISEHKAGTELIQAYMQAVTQSTGMLQNVT